MSIMSSTCEWERGMAEDTHIEFLCFVNVNAPLPHWIRLIKHKFNNKIIKNFKIAITFNQM